MLVRTQDDAHMEELEKLGATDVIPVTLEATMMVAQRVLQNLGVSAQDAMHTIDKIRLDRYNSLRTYFRSDSDARNDGDNDSHLNTLILRRGDYAVEKEINDLQTNEFNVTIASLRRGEVRGDLPSGDTLLQNGDALT